MRTWILCASMLLVSCVDDQWTCVVDGKNLYSPSTSGGHPKDNRVGPLLAQSSLGIQWARATIGS